MSGNKEFRMESFTCICVKQSSDLRLSMSMEMKAIVRRVFSRKVQV